MPANIVFRHELTVVLAGGGALAPIVFFIAPAVLVPTSTPSATSGDALIVVSALVALGRRRRCKIYIYILCVLVGIW